MTNIWKWPKSPICEGLLCKKSPKLRKNDQVQIQDVKKWFVHRNSGKIMHLVKIRQNHSIKDLTQSKVIVDIKLQHFFVFSEFLRHFGFLNLMKTWEAWWGLLNSTKTYPVLKLNASFQIIRPANSSVCDISQLEVGTISFSHFLRQTCAPQSNFSHFWPNLSKRYKYVKMSPTFMQVRIA